MNWLPKLKPIVQRMGQVDPFMFTLNSIAVAQVSGYIYFGVQFFQSDKIKDKIKDGTTHRTRQT
jgi:hypothetical protein